MADRRREPQIDARTQTEAAPDGQTDMRCRPADQSLPTDVSGSASPSARSICFIRSPHTLRSVDKLHASWLTWDIRTYGNIVGDIAPLITSHLPYSHAVLVREAVRGAVEPIPL